MICTSKLLNLKLKTWPKQLLGSLLLVLQSLSWVLNRDVSPIKLIDCH